MNEVLNEKNIYRRWYQFQTLVLIKRGYDVNEMCKNKIKPRRRDTKSWTNILIWVKNYYSKESMQVFTYPYLFMYSCIFPLTSDLRTESMAQNCCLHCVSGNLKRE